MSILRYFVPGNFYHIITRGNNKQQIFFFRRDYLRYLKNLEKYSKKFNIQALAYCLMPNHVHLLVKQKSETTVTDFMQSLNTAYSMYFNIKHSRSGHLFQGPFKHVLVETEEYLVHLSRYIHLNPSSANLARKPENYPWSSYKYYLGLEQNDFIDKEFILSHFAKKEGVGDYKDFVDSRIDYQRDISFQKLLLEK